MMMLMVSRTASRCPAEAVAYHAASSSTSSKPTNARATANPARRSAPPNDSGSPQSGAVGQIRQSSVFVHALRRMPRSAPSTTPSTFRSAPHGPRCGHAPHKASYRSLRTWLQGIQMRITAAAAGVAGAGVACAALVWIIEGRRRRGLEPTPTHPTGTRWPIPTVLRHGLSGHRRSDAAPRLRAAPQRARRVAAGSRP